MRTTHSLFLLSALLFSSVPIVQAETLYWTGNGDGVSFSDEANWDKAPSTGTIDPNNLVDDYIVDDATADITGWGRFESMTFTGGSLTLRAGRVAGESLGIYNGTIVVSGGELRRSSLSGCEVYLDGNGSVIVCSVVSPLSTNTVVDFRSTGATFTLQSVPVATVRSNLLERFRAWGRAARESSNVELLDTGGGGTDISALENSGLPGGGRPLIDGFRVEPDESTADISWSQSPTFKYRVSCSSNLTDWTPASPEICGGTFTRIGFQVGLTNDAPCQFFRINQFPTERVTVVTNQPGAYGNFIEWSFSTTGLALRTTLRLADRDANGTFDTLWREDIWQGTPDTLVRLMSVATDSPSGRVVTSEFTFPGIDTNIVSRYVSALNESWGTVSAPPTKESILGFATDNMPRLVYDTVNFVNLAYPEGAVASIDDISLEGSYSVVAPGSGPSATRIARRTAFLSQGGPVIGVLGLSGGTYIIPDAASFRAGKGGGNLIAEWEDIKGKKAREINDYDASITCATIKGYYICWTKRTWGVYGSYKKKKVDSSPSVKSGLDEGVYRMHMYARVYAVSGNTAGEPLHTVYMGTETSGIEVDEPESGGDPPDIDVSPSGISSETDQGQTAPSRVLTVSNDGGGTLRYEVTTDAAWVSIGTYDGKCKEGQSDDIDITFDSDTLPSGTCEGKIAVTDTKQGHKTTINVALTVNPGGGEYQVTVPSTVMWWDSGIDVAAGNTLTFSAFGAWTHHAGARTYGPEGLGRIGEGCVLPEADGGALIGRIGSGAGFGIGTSHSLVSSGSGRLYLCMNDWPGGFGNNSGSVSVHVTVSP
jgi:hypothetical protein